VYVTPAGGVEGGLAPCVTEGRTGYSRKLLVKWNLSFISSMENRIHAGNLSAR